MEKAKVHGYYFKTGQKLLHIKELCWGIFKNTLIHQKVEVFCSPKWYINFVVTLFLKVPECNLTNKSQLQINPIEIWVYHWILCIQSAKMYSDFNCSKVNHNLELFGIKVYTGWAIPTSPSYSNRGVAICILHPVQWNFWEPMTSNLW